MRASVAVLACLLGGCESDELVVHLRLPAGATGETAPVFVTVGRRGTGGETSARLVESTAVPGPCRLTMGLVCWGAMSWWDAELKSKDVGSGCREAEDPVVCTDVAGAATAVDTSATRATADIGTTLLVVLEHRWPWSSALVSSVVIGDVHLERRQGIPESSEWWAVQASARIATYCLLSAERDRVAPADQPLALELAFRLLEGVSAFTAPVDRVHALPDVGFLGYASFERLDYLVEVGTPALREIGVATCSPASR